MSSYHLAPDLIPHYLDALLDHRVQYIWGYSSSLYALAQEALRRKRRDIKMAVAITNAEPLFDYQRQAISEAFQCPVRETYGMAEIVAAASECQAERLHLWPEVGFIEIKKDDLPDRDGNSGEFLCTGLLNKDMPLIRYGVGDRGVLPETGTFCDCGRNLPLLNQVEGRMDDSLYTKDGRLIGRLDPVFKSNLSIQEAQIIQEKIDQLRIRYVLAAGCTSEVETVLAKRIKARMGEVDIIFESLNEIPRTANGKFRPVICNLPVEERQYVETVIR
jgi:phenylacetate-CoA ligase